MDELAATLKRLRTLGWRVGAHNDYALDGALMTFWLFTHRESGRFVKGDGFTDAAALAEVEAAICACPDATSKFDSLAVARATTPIAAEEAVLDEIYGPAAVAGTSARDDVFHDVLFAACGVASRCADEDVKTGRNSVLGAVRVIRMLAEMRGLKCSVCDKPPMPEDRGGGLVSFQCECGFTESPNALGGPA